MIKYNGFKSWKDYIVNTQTYPIGNYDLCSYYLPLSIEIKKSKLLNESLINFHKRKLGKQAFIWNGPEEKLYVWQFDQYLLFVGKNKGWTIELLSSGSKDIALQVYSEHIKRMGVEKTLEELDIENYKYPT